jgi:hypothetical protein
MAVSQVFTFDRYQFNPMEDRAPSVRNTLGWTIRMEQQHPPPGKEETAAPKMQAGLAWQINRNVAWKLVATPTEGSIQTALLLRQWQQPRITASILLTHLDKRHGLAAGWLFAGIGFEMEASGAPSRRYIKGIVDETSTAPTWTGDRAKVEGADADYYYRPLADSQSVMGSGGNSANVPPTKATLPDR